MDKYQMLAELLRNEEKAKKILSESIEETVKNLNELGMDFTAEELREVASEAQKYSAEDLDEKALDGVTGGIAGLCAAACFFWGVSCFAGMAKAWLR